MRRQVPLENLADRAKAYGIASYIVDGNDVVAVYTTAKEAVERARDGEGPILIEAKTFRRRGHAQHDPAEYVPKEMREYWEKRDPIALYEKFLTERKTSRRQGQKRNRRPRSPLLARKRPRLRGKLPHASAGTRCQGRLLYRRRVPQDPQPKWERPLAEVTPAQIQRASRSGPSKVSAAATVSSGGSAPIHFGDTPAPAAGEDCTSRRKAASENCGQISAKQSRAP